MNATDLLHRPDRADRLDTLENHIGATARLARGLWHALNSEMLGLDERDAYGLQELASAVADHASAAELAYELDQRANGERRRAAAPAGADAVVDALDALRQLRASRGPDDDDEDGAEMRAERAVFVATPSSAAGVAELLRFAADRLDFTDGVNDTALDDVFTPALRRAAQFLDGEAPAGAAVAARSQLAPLIERHRAAYAEFHEAVVNLEKIEVAKNEDEPKNSRDLSLAEQNYKETNKSEEDSLMALCQYACNSAEEQRERASYLLSVNHLLNSGNPIYFEALLRSIAGQSA